MDTSRALVFLSGLLTLLGGLAIVNTLPLARSRAPAHTSAVPRGAGEPAEIVPILHEHP